jgi:hypothetical protein
VANEYLKTIKLLVLLGNLHVTKPRKYIGNIFLKTSLWLVVVPTSLQKKKILKNNYS